MPQLKPILYQFNVSHYCEKVRWALDYKGVDYEKRTLLPGLHAKKARGLAGATHLPILQTHAKTINQSTDILDEIDRLYPSRPLLTDSVEMNAEIREWEQFADTDIGPHVRRICYHTLLHHKKLLVPLLTQGGPWYGKVFLGAIFPKFCEIMRVSLNTSDAETANSHNVLDKALIKIHRALNGTDYLVGNSFTRADLTVAALLAPLCQPTAYPVQWPEFNPEPLASTLNKFAQRLQFVDELYLRHRTSVVSRDSHA